MPSSGFKHLEGTLAEGIVIQDITGTQTNGNEYVWVPVEGTLERKAFMGEDLTSTFTEDVGTAYNTMATQVEKYNGFYVSRYEAGTSTISDGSLSTTGSLKPLSQKNKYVWNNIAWDSSGNYPGDDTQTGAALVAKSAYPENSPVASSLLYGAQYDAMLNYINTTSTSVTNSTTWGNHSDSSITVSAGARIAIMDEDWNLGGYGNVLSGPITKTSSDKWLLTTGASEQSKAKNIYDVAGNVFEWSYELRPASYSRVVRSGGFYGSGADFPAACRNSIVPGDSDGGCGFRFALYIK